jgi:hypothetical protein
LTIGAYHVPFRACAAVSSARLRTSIWLCRYIPQITSGVPRSTGAVYFIGALISRRRAREPASQPTSGRDVAAMRQGIDQLVGRDKLEVLTTTSSLRSGLVLVHVLLVVVAVRVRVLIAEPRSAVQHHREAIARIVQRYANEHQDAHEDEDGRWYSPTLHHMLTSRARRCVRRPW